MIFRFFPRMRLTSPGRATRTRITRKAGGQVQKDSESGTKSAGKKELRVPVGSSERRRMLLADWLSTGQVDSGLKRKKDTDGAVAAGLAAQVHVNGPADVARRVYRELKKPMASG